MKAYERLNVEVVKFEAQDVITASVAAPTECTCDPNDNMCQSNQHYGRCPYDGPAQGHSCFRIY